LIPYRNSSSKISTLSIAGAVNIPVTDTGDLGDLSFLRSNASRFCAAMPDYIPVERKYKEKWQRWGHSLATRFTS